MEYIICCSKCDYPIRECKCLLTPKEIEQQTIKKVIEIIKEDIKSHEYLYEKAVKEKHRDMAVHHGVSDTDLEILIEKIKKELEVE